jgi:hypothetical protein
LVSRPKLVLEREAVFERVAGQSSGVPVKCVKPGQNFTPLDVTTDKSFENLGALPARKLALDAIMRVRVAQRLPPTPHLYRADFWSRLCDYGHDFDFPKY